MRRKIAAVLLFVAFLATSSAAMHPARVVAKFGGECAGANFNPTPKLAALIRRVKLRQQRPCDSEFCSRAFRFDLNADGRNEYFVRLSCGATGNCTWGIFSDRPARLRGVISAWFFYVHRRKDSWNTLTTYTRVGGDEGVIATLHNRRGTYVQTSERTERGDYRDPQPFLTRMGVPKCS